MSLRLDELGKEYQDFEAARISDSTNETEQSRGRDTDTSGPTDISNVDRIGEAGETWYGWFLDPVGGSSEVHPVNRSGYHGPCGSNLLAVGQLSNPDRMDRFQVQPG